MSDLIDRQALIESLYESFVNAQEWVFEASDAETKVRAKSAVATFMEAILRVKQMPSTHPEIIRCKDCKYWDVSGYCIDFMTQDKNGFCSWAERRIDE